MRSPSLADWITSSEADIGDSIRVLMPRTRLVNRIVRLLVVFAWVVLGLAIVLAELISIGIVMDYISVPT
jgi:hypothetical protein